jgi:hypothetical protein
MPLWRSTEGKGKPVGENGEGAGRSNLHTGNKVSECETKMA